MPRKTDLIEIHGKQIKIQDLIGFRSGYITIKDVNIETKEFLADCDCGNIGFKFSARDLISRKGAEKKYCSHQCIISCAYKRLGLKSLENYTLLRDKLRLAIKRCHDPECEFYDGYGGKGISVFDEWRVNTTSGTELLFHELTKVHGKDVERLLEAGFELDRRNFIGNYEPNNVRLISSAHNQNNKSGSVYLNIGGSLYTYAECSNKWGMACQNTIRGRIIRQGWDEIDAVFTPVKKVKRELLKNFFGLHLMVDGYLSDVDKLSDLDYIFKFLDSMPSRIGMTKISQPHVFPYSGKNPKDCGVTGIVILAESHASLHTFTDRDGYFSFDVFSCKPFDSAKVIKIILEELKPKAFEVELIKRGSSFPREDGYDYLRNGKVLTHNERTIIFENGLRRING